MKITIDQIKKKAIPILKDAGVTRSALFGSYVYGEEREDSDIDMLVELPREKSLFEFIELKLRLEQALRRKIDLVEYIAIKPRLKQYILPSQIKIL